MWRPSTSRTFFGESCSRATVDMVAPSGAKKAETSRGEETLALPRKRRHPCRAGEARLNAYACFRGWSRRAPPAGRRALAGLVRERGRDPRVLEARGGAAILAVLLRAVERGVRGSEELVLLLLHGRAGGRVRTNRGEAERRGDHSLEVERGLVESVRAEEERRAADRGADRFRDLHAFLEAVSRKDEHELVAPIARERRALVGHGAAQQVADLAQHLAAGEVAVAVVHVLEVVEVEEDDRAVAAVAGDPRELLREPQVQVALVVQARQAVPLRDLVRAPRVEQVLDRDRRVVGEDLEQPAILLSEAAGPGAVDELEHAA